MPSRIVEKSEFSSIPEKKTSDNEEVDNWWVDGEPPKIEIVWRNVILLGYLHGSSIYGLYLLFSGAWMWNTFFWAIFLTWWAGMGITAGAHRHWAHKSYKVKWPLKIFLVIGQTIAFQNCIWEWSRDHRVHHKFSETHADPHNAKRGFFFSHIGWLLCKKHKAVSIKGKTVDMSDLEADPVIMFQKKYYPQMIVPVSLFFPALVPYYCWGETFLASWYIASNLRYCLSLHGTWLVNSAAHMWGDRPYDLRINPSENRWVAYFAFGEGWHNYHHVFPWDYKASELGGYRYNPTRIFIDFCAKVGLAYDLKTVPTKVVEQRIQRTGKPNNNISNSVTRQKSRESKIVSGPWGWGDEEIPQEDRRVTQTLYSRESNEMRQR